MSEPVMTYTVSDATVVEPTKQRVLITGGAGFIGSHVADWLIEHGHEVVVVDNLVTGRRDNVNPQARFVEMDIVSHDFQALYEEVKPDYCVHAAASYKDPNDHWSDMRTNGLGGVQVARLAKRCGTKRVIYFQTALCYGLNPRSPVEISEPLSPWNTSYALSKTAGEQCLLLEGIPLTVLRLAHICGPRNISGPIPTFFRKILNGELCRITDSRRDFVHVGDLVDVVAKIITGRAPALPVQQIYHVSSGTDWPILAIYHFVAAAIGKHDGDIEILAGGPDDAKTILLNANATRLFYRWQPQTTVKDSIRQAVEWYRQHGVKQTYTHLRGVAAK